TRADHSRVIRAAVAAMREVDSDRLIIVDGIDWGNSPCPELRDLAVGQSCRGYLPFPLSHYRAPWFNGSNSWSAPVWPDLKADRVIWNRRQLERHYARWERLAKQGVWVNCGEGGAYNKTPHAIVLAWLRDVLEVLTSYGIGFVLWNFRGPFGVLDSARPDVDYEDLCGHKLDRKLLSLLQEFA
ncbi:MAG: cellulase family glycosylhydrolase, partial [Armatimonadota bacterium]|nr:cellulase family glycosylhydrolase [Armatimonadota bacterium]